jgi:TPR repeat protein
MSFRAFKLYQTTIPYCIIAFLFVSQQKIASSEDLTFEGDAEACGITLVALEDERDNAFYCCDSLKLERLTRDVCNFLFLDHNMFILNAKDVIVSILKTRHLFPGKVDTLEDFYSIDRLSSLPKTLAFIFLIDFLCQDSISDLRLYKEFQSILNNYKQDKQMILKKRILDEFDDIFFQQKKINNESIKSEIEKLFDNVDLIRIIIREEMKFAPVVTFKNLYNDLMVDSTYHGYTVLNTNSYHYWPINIMASERREFQKQLSKNGICGRLRPLSIKALNINQETAQSFPLLKNLKGSFIPYVSNHFEGVEEEGLIILFTENTSDISYQYEKIQQVKLDYKKNPYPTVVKKEGDILYYAEQNVASCQYEYARILESKEKNIFNNAKLSFLYFRQAAKQGLVDAQKRLGEIYFSSSLFLPRDYVKAIHWYELAVEQKDVNAQNNLGMMYFFGKGVEKNVSRGIALLKESATKGCVDAQSNLGFIYLKGSGVEVDLPQAIKWFTGAALKGCVDSQYNLGFIHCELLRKSQSPHNFRLGSFWYNEAATAGHTLAQYNLGLLYLDGLGVEKNVEEAVSLFAEAGKKGDVRAQYNLGLIYEEGIGITKDFKESLKWYSLAAAQNDGDAMCNLGLMLLNQEECGENINQALTYFTDSANKGFSRALIFISHFVSKWILCQ